MPEPEAHPAATDTELDEPNVEVATLRGKRVVLRRALETDIEARLEAGNDPEATRMYGGSYRPAEPYTRERAEKWYESQLQEPYRWVIEVDGRCVGAARLHSLNQTDRRARYAVGIFNPEIRNQGIGTETTRLILRYAFEELRLHRVDLRVLDYNKRAMPGFIREGVERESAVVDGEWFNDVMMSILEQEYRELSPTWFSESGLWNLESSPHPLGFFDVSVQ
jgi:[ribosomal protein S5]-alanine N-acetyltransferase